jgi:hypothetical protein
MAIEDKSTRKAKRLLQLERIIKMRQKLARRGLAEDSLDTLKKIREEREKLFQSAKKEFSYINLL